MHEDRWVPVLKGDKYCSPGCGTGCTLAEFNRAKKGAEILQKRMGDGWKIRIWENCGWFYQVSKGDVVVHAPRDKGGEYWIDLKVNGVYQIELSHKSPVKGYKLALDRARDVANGLIAELRHHAR